MNAEHNFHARLCWQNESLVLFFVFFICFYWAKCVLIVFGQKFFSWNVSEFLPILPVRNAGVHILQVNTFFLFLLGTGKAVFNESGAIFIWIGLFAMEQTEMATIFRLYSFVGSFFIKQVHLRRFGFSCSANFGSIVRALT